LRQQSDRWHEQSTRDVTWEHGDNYQLLLTKKFCGSTEENQHIRREQLSCGNDKFSLMAKPFVTWIVSWNLTKSAALHNLEHFFRPLLAPVFG
jgi:hypothetical protein